MSEPTGNAHPDAQAHAAHYQNMQNEADASASPEAVVEQSIASESPLQDLTAALEAAKAEADKNREAMLRLAADLENTRRRNVEEVAKAHKFAIESFAEALLPARDSLEASLNFTDLSLDSLREGVAATLRQLEQAFEKGKVVVMNPVGEKFDPNRHQAVSMVPGNAQEPPVPANHVVAVLQKGYLINDRVLRPALVSVAQ